MPDVWRRVLPVALAAFAWACGTSDTSRLPTVPTLDEQGAAGFASVSAGLDHTCALSVVGVAYCWGSDADGQLGHPATALCDTAAAGACSLAAEPVATLLRFRSISAGAHHTCAVTTEFAAYCWGSNATGALGMAAASTAIPQPVSGGLLFASLSAGFSNTCGVGTNGTAYCWGANDRGQLGTGDSTRRAVPTPVASATRFVEISTGQGRTCARSVDNVVFCWGAIWEYSKGGFEFTRPQLVPEVVAGAPDLSGLSVGTLTTCGVAGQAAYCWEANAFGEMGDGTTDGATMPTPVSGGLRFTQLSAGIIQTCGVTADGAAYCWGNDSFGQLGVGSAALSERCGLQRLPCALAPVRVPGWRAFTSISTGLGNHVCAVTRDTNVYCWGLAQSGQLGYGRRVGATSQALKVAIALP